MGGAGRLAEPRDESTTLRQPGFRLVAQSKIIWAGHRLTGTMSARRHELQPAMIMLSSARSPAPAMSEGVRARPSDGVGNHKAAAGGFGGL